MLAVKRALVGASGVHYVQAVPALEQPRRCCFPIILSPERIPVPLRGKEKPVVLGELVALVADNGGPQFEDVLAAVTAREAVLSTAIDYGVAIPHGESPLLPELRLAAGTSAEPVGFDARDAEPVGLFFLLVGPEGAGGAHVKALSRLSRLVREEPFREQLLTARDPGEFCRFFREGERR